MHALPLRPVSQHVFEHRCPARPIARRLSVLTLAALVPLFVDAASAQEPDGWKSASPASVGLDASGLAELTRTLEAGEHGNVHALLIEKDGRLVYEEYFTGQDESLGQDLGRVTFGRTSLHDIRSVGKSIVATLVGIAIEEGAIRSVDEPLHALLPGYAHLLTGGKRDIHLRHLLGMSAGLRWDEWTLPFSDPENDWIRLVRNPDPVAFVLGLDLVAEPGSTFVYNTGLTQLLAAVLERATGEEIEDYADRVLFRPLGIYDVVWRGDLGGIPSAGAGIRMRPRDVAKLGSLYLHGGRWNGKQVVPEAWVEAATLPRLPASFPESAPDFVAGFDYGYQWWVGRYRTAEGELHVPMMAGNGEQRVMVARELGVVLTVVAGEYGEVTWMPDRLLVQHVLEATGAQAGLGPITTPETGGSVEAARSCGAAEAEKAPERPLGLASCGTAEPAQLLYVWMGDADRDPATGELVPGQDRDFLAVYDVDPQSSSYGDVLSTLPVDLVGSLPHHTEYQMPASGEPLFANAHLTEDVLMFDLTDGTNPRVAGVLEPVPPLRFPHDMVPLPNGNVLVGFLRSEGPSPVPGDSLMPGGHGGLAEFTRAGELVRWASAADPEISEPVRPYSFAVLPDVDRLVVTSAPMAERHSADVVQIWRLSDLTLLETLPLPPGLLSDGTLLMTRDPSTGELFATGHELPFEPRVMDDGSVLLNTYGCGFYRVSGLDRGEANIENVYTIDRAGEPGLGACGIPVHTGQFWVMTVGDANTLVTLDVSDPAAPREVARLGTGADFAPHWLAKDPRSDRLIVGADNGGEDRMLMVYLDPETGELGWDERLRTRNGLPGIDFRRAVWPHGETGPAFGHAAVFGIARGGQ